VTWKAYGPDASGRFGGLQGVGGLEMALDATHTLAAAVLGDAQGHVVGYSAPAAPSGAAGAMTWNVFSSGYGPLPGQSVLRWSQTGASGTTASFVAALNWQGRRMDASGYYWLGAREYDPVGGKFLAPDPAGQDGSWDLYSYAGGDPINKIDPTGMGAQDQRNIAAVASTNDPNPSSGDDGFRPQTSYLGGAGVTLYNFFIQEPINIAEDVDFSVMKPLMHPLEAMQDNADTVGAVSANLIYNTSGTIQQVGNGALNTVTDPRDAGNLLPLAVGAAALSPETEAAGGLVNLGDAGVTLSKAERLNIIFNQLGLAAPATTADEAMALMNNTLESVEDLYSGVPKDASPPRTATPRMYPPQADSMVTAPDGSITAGSAKHVTVYGADGSITVTPKGSSTPVFTKPGGG